MQLQALLGALLALATVTIATPVTTNQPRQLLNSILCSVTGTTTCNLECELLKQTGGQCNYQKSVLE